MVLRGPTPVCAAPPVATPIAPVIAADVTQDFGSVVCPLNHVKTKMTLGGLRAGQVLAVLLDEKGARNVPESAAKDGHEVLAVEREQKHGRVV